MNVYKVTTFYQNEWMVCDEHHVVARSVEEACKKALVVARRDRDKATPTKRGYSTNPRALIRVRHVVEVCRVDA